MQIMEEAEKHWVEPRQMENSRDGADMTCPRWFLSYEGEAILGQILLRFKRFACFLA